MWLNSCLHFKISIVTTTFITDILNPCSSNNNYNNNYLLVFLCTVTFAGTISIIVVIVVLFTVSVHPCLLSKCNSVLSSFLFLSPSRSLCLCVSISHPASFFLFTQFFRMAAHLWAWICSKVSACYRKVFLATVPKCLLMWEWLSIVGSSQIEF